jgi:hypothetical protein
MASVVDVGRRRQHKGLDIKMKAFLVLGSAASVLAANACPPSDCSKTPLKNNKVCDTSLSPTDRAAALVAAMTQSEKMANLLRQTFAPQTCP